MDSTRDALLFGPKTTGVYPQQFSATQREGFEPPEPCGSSAFEADAISQLDHRCIICVYEIIHNNVLSYYSIKPPKEGIPNFTNFSDICKKERGPMPKHRPLEGDEKSI